MIKNNIYCPIHEVDEFRPLNSPGDKLAPYYIINRNGDIFTNQYECGYLSHIITEKGYHVVSLQTIDGTRIQRRVHRLVMFTFNYFLGCEQFEVDHKDGNKSNNNISNLDWVTGKENVSRAIENGLRKAWSNDNNPKAVVSEQDVMKIVELALNGLSNEQILEQIPNANISIISNIVLGNTWNSLISKDDIEKIKNLRTIEILSFEDKHKICSYFQNNINDNLRNKYGYVTNLIKSAVISVFGYCDDSKFRMAKRLFYRYQDDYITSLYKY